MQPPRVTDNMRRRVRNPDWPRLMAIDVACAYLGDLDQETFLAKVAPSLTPIKVDRRELRYDRVDLDTWVDRGGIGHLKRTDDDWLKAIDDA